MSAASPGGRPWACGSLLTCGFVLRSRKKSGRKRCTNCDRKCVWPRHGGGGLTIFNLFLIFKTNKLDKNTHLRVPRALLVGKRVVPAQRGARGRGALQAATLSRPGPSGAQRDHEPRRRPWGPRGGRLMAPTWASRGTTRLVYRIGAPHVWRVLVHPPVTQGLGPGRSRLLPRTPQLAGAASGLTCGLE